MENPIHILVVDDEESFTYFVKLNLETTTDPHFLVTTANRGEEALKLARTVRPDLILLDIMMPDMSGEDLAEELSSDARTQNIPIIFVTALVQKDEVRKQAGLMGGQEFIAKPVGKDELINRIKATLKLPG